MKQNNETPEVKPARKKAGSSRNPGRKKKLFLLLSGACVLGLVVAALWFFGKWNTDKTLSYKYEQEKELSVFSDNLVCVKKDGIYGYMNPKGEMVIDFQFDDATKFANGLAAVAVNGEWFVIGKDGRNVLNERYDSVSVNDNGLIIFAEGSKFGVVNRKGTIIVQALYDSISEYSEGLAAVRLNGKYGYINEDGHMVISRDYDLAYPFSDGLGLVKKGTRYAYLNRNGENVTEFIFDAAYPFIHERAVVARKSPTGVLRYGVIDVSGKTVISRDYDAIERKLNTESKVLIAKKENLYYLLDLDGKILNPIGYVSITTEDVTTFMISETASGTKNIINEANQTLFEHVEEYDDVSLIADYNQKYFALQKAGKWYLYDNTGKSVLTYETDEIFVYGDAAVVKKDGIYGAIGLDGNVIVDFLYDTMSGFIKGYSMVKIGINYGVINSLGEIVIPIQYQDVEI